MRFFVDQSCPRLLAVRLAQQGHEVEYAVDVGPGALDEIWADRATNLGQIIVAQDYDFGDLAHQGRTPNGVVQVAPLSGPLSARVERVVDVIGAEGDALIGVLTTVEAHRVRRRPLAD